MELTNHQRSIVYTQTRELFKQVQPFFQRNPTQPFEAFQQASDGLNVAIKQGVFSQRLPVLQSISFQLHTSITTITQHLQRYMCQHSPTEAHNTIRHLTESLNANTTIRALAADLTPPGQYGSSDIHVFIPPLSTKKAGSVDEIRTYAVHELVHGLQYGVMNSVQPKPVFDVASLETCSRLMGTAFRLANNNPKIIVQPLTMKQRFKELFGQPQPELTRTVQGLEATELNKLKTLALMEVQAYHNGYTSRTMPASYNHNACEIELPLHARILKSVTDELKQRNPSAY